MEPTSSRILRSAAFLAAFCKAANVVESSAFYRIDVSEIRGVQQNDLRPEFIRERDRVEKTFPRATGKIDWDKNCLDRGL